LTTEPLLDGGGDAHRSSITEGRPLPVLVDLDAAGIRLALAHEDLEHPTDDEVIDLRDLALDVQAEVVDHRPTAAVLQVEVELVRRVRFGLGAQADGPDLVLDHPSGTSVDIEPAAERLQRLDVRRTVVGVLELHGPSRNSDAATCA